jgi:hypothetical protein
MLFAAYRVSDGQFLRVWPNVPPFDPATEGMQAYPETLRPDLRTERFDGTAGTKKRAATAQELADYDAARAGEIEAAQFDGQKMLKAVAMYFAQQAGIPLNTAKAGIVAIYRGL